MSDFSYFEEYRIKNITEKELFEKYYNNELLIENVIANYYLYALKIAYSFSNIEFLIDFDDRSSIAMKGLIRAIEKFDINKNINFTTFSGTVIKNDLLYALRKINRKKLDTVSLNKELFYNYNDDSQITFEKFIKDDVNIEEECENNFIKQYVLDKINKIKHLKHRSVLRDYYLYGMNQEEIANKNGFSQSYASRLIIKYIKEIRLNMVKDEILTRDQYLKITNEEIERNKCKIRRPKKMKEVV